MQKKSAPKPKSVKEAKPRARREQTCIIKAEVSPAVAARLVKLCEQVGLPYPDGIAYVLEAACRIVDKRGASATTPAKKKPSTSKKARR